MENNRGSLCYFPWTAIIKYIDQLNIYYFISIPPYLYNNWYTNIEEENTVESRKFEILGAKVLFRIINSSNHREVHMFYRLVIQLFMNGQYFLNPMCPKYILNYEVFRTHEI